LQERRTMANSADGGQLHAVETGWTPAAESTLLMDLLTRSPGLSQSLSDPTEVQDDQNPLVRVNAYKHRLHALRCEYVHAHLQTLDQGAQLAESRLRIARLEERIKHLEGTLEQMQATRVWRAAVTCNRWRRTVSQYLRRIGGCQPLAPAEHR
jgi:hypothetical protein